MWVCGVSSTGTSAGCGEWLTCRPGWSVEGERARTRLKRGRKRVARAVGPSGGCAGPSARGRGGGPVERREEEAGWATSQGLLDCWVGWAGLSFCFGFPFLFQTTLKLFEFKSTLNSNSYALNQRKLMHQHECTNKSNLENF